MMVSDKHKIIWICVPGTGTRSFEKQANANHMNFLLADRAKYPLETDIPMAIHYPAFLAKKLIPEDKWDSYEKIAFIRNPYTWMTSVYNHTNIKNIGMVAEKRPFDEFIRKNDKTPYYWYLDTDGTMLIDTLYKTEELDTVVFPRFKMGVLHLNQTSKNKPKLEYTEEMKHLMKKRFWREFKHYE